MALTHDNRPHFVVVGAGVAGCTLAYSLSEWARVTLVEAGALGQQGASALPLALLNPNRGRSGRASELDKAGLEAMWTLVQAMKRQGYDPGVYASGVLRIASSARQARKWQRLEGLSWLEPEALSAPYHAPFGAFKVEAGGWVRPQQFLKALVQVAGVRGTKLMEGCHVQAIKPLPAGIELSTSEGKLTADGAILCVGARPFAGLEDLGLERVAGDIIGLEGIPELPYPIAGAVYGGQRDGTVFIGGNHRSQASLDPEGPGQLQRTASWFIPALAEAKVTSVWTGLRAKRADHQPLVQQLAPGLWFFGALAGRGFLCSAYLSRQLAQQLAAAHGVDDDTSH